jgi:hypothetical protein
MRSCHSCKKELSLGREIGRRDECPFCGADLHCCLNCKFYDPHAPKQCREPQAELVRVKDKANFCDFFVFAEGRAGADSGAGADKTRKALDDLFRK